MKQNFFLILFLTAFSCLFAQNNATITVTDLNSGTPVQGATVIANSVTVQTDVIGQAVFTNLPDGNYSYTVSKICYIQAADNFVIAGENVTLNKTIAAVTTNDVNFGMSNFGNNPTGFSINLTNGTFNQTIASGNPLGDYFSAVPFGTYTYTITKNCFQTATGQVIVNCNAGDPNFVFAVPVAKTTNDVNFGMSNFGNNPTGFSINLTNGTFNQTIASGNPLGDYFSAVPFGTYTYTITKNCFQTATGQVIVNCNAGDPNFVFAVPVAKTTNDVNFGMSNFGNNPTGFSINLTNGTFNQTIVSGNPLGDYFSAVPFGTYTYTITKNCFQTATGQVIVNCNAGDPNFVFAVPVAKTTNDLLVYMSNFGFNPEGFTINLTNATYNESITSGDPLNDIFENVPFGTYTYTISKDCFQTITGQVTINCNNGEGNSIFEVPEAVVLDNTVTQVENLLTANATGVTYQWLDCANNNAPIANATNQVFTATANGNYSVEITNGNCSITSTCYVVSNLSTVAIDTTLRMTVFPNPASNVINIKFDKNFETIAVDIVNMTGQVVKKVTASQNNLISIDITALPTGIYILRTDDNANSTTSRIVKK